MNSSTKYVMAMLETSTIVRDTLEVFIPNHKMPIQTKENREKLLSHLLEDNSPISLFCKRNGENGAKILRQTKEFYEDVYGENSTILTKEEDGYKFDTSKSNQVLDFIVGLFETYFEICLGFANAFKEEDKKAAQDKGIEYDENSSENKLEPEFVKLLKLTEESYRSMVFFTLSSCSIDKFLEFNNIMNQNKGKEDPSATFVQNEFQQIMGFIKFVESKSKVESEEYLKNVEQMKKYLEYFGNTQKLTDEKIELKQLFNDLHDVFVKEVNESRNSWQELFNKVYQDLVDFEKNEMQSKKD